MFPVASPGGHGQPHGHGHQLVRSFGGEVGQLSTLGLIESEDFVVRPRKAAEELPLSHRNQEGSKPNYGPVDVHQRSVGTCPPRGGTIHNSPGSLQVRGLQLGLGQAERSQ